MTKISFKLRRLLVIFVLAITSITITNCSKTTSEVVPNEIIGTWKITNLFVKEGAGKEEDQFPLLLAIIPCFKDISFSFKTNGEMTATTPKECEGEAEDFVGTAGNAKYAINAGKLTITDADGTKTTQDVSFSGNQMTLISSEIDAGVSTTSRTVFTKQ